MRACIQDSNPFNMNTIVNKKRKGMNIGDALVVLYEVQTTVHEHGRILSQVQYDAVYSGLIPS